jgi:hypothetical protein
MLPPDPSSLTAPLPCWRCPSVRSRWAVLLPVATHQKVGQYAMPSTLESPATRGRRALEDDGTFSLAIIALPISHFKSPAADAPLYFRVEAQLSLQLAPVTKTVYQPHGINVLQLLFKKHFQSSADQYEHKHAIIYGRFRIARITEVVEKFILCGDYSQGIARIQTRPSGTSRSCS